MGEPLDDVDYLSRSSNRIETLAALRRSGPLTRSELRDAVDASRSTVSRTVDGLVERGWIIERPDGYHLTPAGRAVSEDLGTLLETIRITRRLDPVLTGVPDSLFEFDPRCLTDASITRATSSDPYAPANRQTKPLRTVEEFRGLFPSIDLKGSNVVHERIVSGALTASIVVDSGVAATITTDPYAELFRTQIASGNLEVAVYDGDIPCYVGLPAGEPVQIAVEDDERIPRALLETDAAEAREWAEESYRRYRERSEELSPAEF